MPTVYTLQLAHGCWYVGKSDDVPTRLADHRAGRGCEWTRAHPPLKLVRETRADDAFAAGLEEERRTKELMFAHGVDKVRGGPYAGVELSAAQLQELQRSFAHASDSCFKCGSREHFARACPRSSAAAAVAAGGSSSLRRAPAAAAAAAAAPLAYTQASAGDISSTAATAGVCARCGRDTHDYTDCFAVWHVAGWRIEDEDEEEEEDEGDESDEGDDGIDFAAVRDCDRCGRDGHVNRDCYASRHANGRLLQPQASRSSSAAAASSSSPSRGVRCARCERTGHALEACYAATRADGSPLRGVSASSSSAPAHTLYAGAGVTGCTRCGRDSHSSHDCYASTHASGAPLAAPYERGAGGSSGSPGRGGSAARLGRGGAASARGCARCGRAGHAISSCYASTGVDGRRL